MPLNKKGNKIMSSMKKTYGPKKVKSVFYASKNAGKIKGVDNGFYGHLTHASMQPNEDSVCIIGDGFGDSYLPKVPKTDKYSKTNLR
jgi:hypothetical protein